jgi:hypothetical protein
MNIFYRSFAGSLMKTTNTWYKTLPGLRPAAVAPQEDMPGLPWVRELFMSLELMDYIVLQKSRISLMGSLRGLKPFPEISCRGLPLWRGQSPQERHEKIGFQQRQNII